MRLLNTLFMLLATTLLTTGLALAEQDIVGHIKTVRGTVSILAAGTTSPAQPGRALHKGDVLTTGSDGSVGATLQDNTMVSAGPDSEISLADYLYAPGQDELRLAIRLAKGTLHYISGVIAKLRPEAVEIKVPTGLIGVRGTEFVVYVDPQDGP